MARFEARLRAHGFVPSSPVICRWVGFGGGGSGSGDEHRVDDVVLPRLRRLAGG
jgi:hypothetical protein